MRRVAGWRVALFVMILALGATFGAASNAGADIIGPQDPNDPQADSPWQAGTCTSDLGPCSVDTRPRFFEGAAAHPPVGFTQFIVNTEPGGLGPVPIGNLRTVRVDLPPGLAVNPQSSAEQCALAPGQSPSGCPAGSKVGVSEVTATNPATGLSLDLPPADVFNIVPKEGEPALFGLSLLGNDVFLESDIAWESDYHEYFTIHVAKLSLPELPLLGEFARVAKNRLVFDGTSGPDGTFITTPTTCLGPATPGSPLRARLLHLPARGFLRGSEPEFPRGFPLHRVEDPAQTG